MTCRRPAPSSTASCITPKLFRSPDAATGCKTLPPEQWKTKQHRNEDALVCAPGNGAPDRYAAVPTYGSAGRPAAALPHFRPRKPKLRSGKKKTTLKKHT